MSSPPDAPAARQLDNRADRAELILSQLEQLPTLPHVAVRVLQVASSPDSGASELTALIETDQALTSKILSLVRKAHLGAGRNVTTVTQAVVMLGFSAIRNAVLSVQVYELFNASEPDRESDFDRSEFWKHSLATACTARLLARHGRYNVRPDDAFVCGLLHDLGKVALDACLPKSYTRIVRDTISRRACICDVERCVLGLDHTVAGKRLARRWKLPEPVAESIWLHHHAPESLPDSVSNRELLEIVHLADNLVRRQRIGFSGYNRVGDIAGLAGRMGLDDEAVARIMTELGPQIEEHCSLFGLGDLTSTAMYARALSDANEELSRLNVSLTDANRRLQLRSACFDALRRFHERLATDGTVTDVCRAAAACAADALGLEGDAICFATNEARTVYYVGSNRDDALGSTVLTVPEPLSDPAGLPEGRLSSAPEFAQPVRDRMADLLGNGETWYLPVVHAGRVIGGLLFGAPPEHVAKLQSFPEELEALGGAFGLAATGAAVRTESEALIDELADANRRLHGAQEELLRTRSLAMIAAMAAGAAHELNNPLAVISGRAQMLGADLHEEHLQKACRTIAEHAHRASDIVTELLDFAKPDPPQSTDISLLPWFEHYRANWLANAPIAPDGFLLEFSDPSLTVRADADQMTRIFDALVANALEASTPENLRLVVNSASRAADDTVVVAVEDNGRGMEPDVLEHCLDPFFSHRPAGRGRGLGLSRAHSLAVANDGRLWLESTPEVGTTAFVELPAARRNRTG